MDSYVPKQMPVEEVALFLVAEFGGEPLTIRKDDAETYLEWSLPDFEYRFVHEHKGPSRVLNMHISQGTASLTLLML